MFLSKNVEVVNTLLIRPTCQCLQYCTVRPQLRTHFQLNQGRLQIKTRQRSLFTKSVGLSRLQKPFRVGGGGGFVRFKTFGFLSKKI